MPFWLTKVAPPENTRHPDRDRSDPNSTRRLNYTEPSDRVGSWWSRSMCAEPTWARGAVVNKSMAHPFSRFCTRIEISNRCKEFRMRRVDTSSKKIWLASTEPECHIHQTSWLFGAPQIRTLSSGRGLHLMSKGGGGVPYFPGLPGRNRTLCAAGTHI